nr:thymidine kinase [uncultured Anaerocolumna sp.]
MAKLYFKYGCMNSSKSANLLMIKHNYEEQGFRVALLKPSLDDREGKAVIKSRIGLEAKCGLVSPGSSINNYYNANATDVLMIDEAQFLTEKQVDELYKISFDIPVICFGLLIDYSQHLFEGSKRLIELSESIHEIKTVCQCGARANYNGRFDSEGNLITSGEQIVIGGNERYKALCKKCYESLKNQALEKRKDLSK